MPYALVVTEPASKDLSERLPEAAAAAAIELITGSLIDNPRRTGAPLRDEYDGLWSARLGTYRVIYRIDDMQRQIDRLTSCASLIVGTPTEAVCRSDWATAPPGGVRCVE